MSDEQGFTDDGIDVGRISAYLDAGRTPYDRLIEDSPEARRLLTEMERLRELGGQLITAEADTLAAPKQNWFADVLEQIARDSRPGRDLPISDAAGQVLTEGALRGVIRQTAGQRVHGLIIERCAFSTGIVELDRPFDVSVKVALVWPEPAQPAADALRNVIAETIREQLGRGPRRINIRVQEVHVSPTASSTTNGSEQ